MPDTSQQIFEFRGVDEFYFAEVLQDDKNAYLCGTPVNIPVQEVGKTVDASNEAHYYDNKAMIVVSSESPDTISLVIAPPALDKLSTMIGKSFDATTGMMVDSPRKNKYFAIMYRTKGTDGGYRYVSRLKGQFNIPEESVNTEDDGTDTSNTTIEFTGVYTVHEFTKGIFNGSSWEKSGVKGIVVDARYGLANLTNFFAQVQTPDSISAAGTVNVTGVVLNPSTLNFTELNDTDQLNATVSPASATDKSVSFSSSDTEVATVSETGLVTAKANGSAIITVTTTDGGFTDICGVTVNAE